MRAGIFHHGVRMSLLEILLLYIAFRFKQLACDFFLQTSWMAITKGNPLREGGGRALFAHAGVHAVFTFFVVAAFSFQFWWLAFVDFAAHGLIDKAKATLTKKKGWTYADAAYWWAFGIDQEAHNLTHLAYIVLIVWGSGVPLQ